MAMENDPPLTEAEERALEEYERLTCVAYECYQSPGVASEQDAARTAAVAAIRAAERERVLVEMERAVQVHEDEELHGAPYIRQRIAELRGEGAR